MRDVKGFEGLYKVTEDGQVWSVRKNRFLKLGIGTHGYKVAYLHKNGEKKNALVHRLVASAYCEGKAEGLVVDHEDGNKLNNHYTNLFWKTQRDNVKNQMERGTFTYKEAHKQARIARRKPVRVFFPDGKTKDYEASIDVCKELNLQPSKVSQVLNGKRNHHKGFYFERI